MKWTIALALSASLARLPLGTPAQASIRDTMAREAARLAAVEPARPSPHPNRSGRATSDWSAVRELDPGTEIVLIVHDSPPGKRYVLTSEDASLTVLNVSDPAIPQDVRQALIDEAIDHPERLAMTREGRENVVNKRVRVASDGVFLDDRRLVPLDAVVAQLPRPAIVEISITDRAVARGIGWGALIGAAIGVPIMRSYCRTNSCDSQGALLFPLIVGVGMGFGGAVGSQQQVKTVVYRAP